MEQLEKIIYCADCIVQYGTGFVIVERLKDGGGLALPGGKQDPGESHSECALRELKEETGLSGTIVSTFKTVADDGRDPRGKFVSTIFVVRASGTLRSEAGKTRPVVMSRAEIEAQYARLMFDHGDILRDYFSKN